MTTCSISSVQTQHSQHGCDGGAGEAGGHMNGLVRYHEEVCYGEFLRIIYSTCENSLRNWARSRNPTGRWSTYSTCPMQSSILFVVQCSSSYITDCCSLTSPVLSSSPCCGGPPDCVSPPSASRSRRCDPGPPCPPARAAPATPPRSCGSRRTHNPCTVLQNINTTSAKLVKIGGTTNS